MSEVSVISRYINGKETDKELLNQVFGIRIEPIGERIIELLDLLECQIIGEAIERKFSGYHLKNYASQCPIIRAEENKLGYPGEPRDIMNKMVPSSSLIAF